MSKLNVLIVEDDLGLALDLEVMLKDEHRVLPIAKSVKAAVDILEKEEVDIVISDIFLEGERNGIDLLKILDKSQTPVIMMTFSKDENLYHKVQSKNLAGYLVKPVEKLTLISTIDQAMANQHKASPVESIDASGAADGQVYRESFFIRTNKQLVKVYVKDIKWIQSDGNYCLVVTDTRKYAIKLSLTKLLKKLPAELFVQAHKRYLVQLNTITKVDTSASSLYIGEEVIPIGRKYKPDLLNRLDRFS